MVGQYNRIFAKMNELKETKLKSNSLKALDYIEKEMTGFRTLQDLQAHGFGKFNLGHQAWALAKIKKQLNARGHKDYFKGGLQGLNIK
jgi:hypothetical protein